MKVLMVTPPIGGPNTPYPATPYITAFLEKSGWDCQQRDLSLAVLLRLFSTEGLTRVQSNLASNGEPSESLLRNIEQYKNCIETVVRFLQSKDNSLSVRILSRGFIPWGLRIQKYAAEFRSGDPLASSNILDRASRIATLCLKDIADGIQCGLDSLFELKAYGESIAHDASFGPLLDALERNDVVIDGFIRDVLEQWIEEIQPDVVGVTMPFPGNVYGGLKALEIARTLSEEQGRTLVTIVGGGFANTALRELSDPRFFRYVDYLVFDDGELPTLRLLQYLDGQGDITSLVRTRYLRNGKIIESQSREKDAPFRETVTPTYRGLPLSDYLSLSESDNPMSRLWDGFRWNKLILAHGCYWKRCTFCDVSLDYIGRYDPNTAKGVVKQMQEMVKSNDMTGFHFVDEAAPPKLLRQMSEELLEQKMTVSWWGNIRFDSYFTPDICKLMARSGCVAVSGGIEVASDRLLKQIDKGVTLQQLVRVTQALSTAGIYVHAYLMFGFPSQTLQETIDSLEVVRQLFNVGCIHAGAWHRLTTTTHSDIGLRPEVYGIKIKRPDRPEGGRFADYLLGHSEVNIDPQLDNASIGKVLNNATAHYAEGQGLSWPVTDWFSSDTPKTSIDENFVRNLLA